MQYLEEAHSNYKEIKSKLLEAGTVSSDRTFNAISDNLVSDVARCNAIFFIIFVPLRGETLNYRSGAVAKELLKTVF